MHLRRETGHVFGAEFADAAGHIVHRFTLDSESDMDEFLAWVRLHQACAAHGPSSWLEDDDAAAPVPPARDIRRCDTGALESVVAGCVDRALPLRATVRGPAATQRAELVPHSLSPCDGWWFASDDQTGLHFRSELFTHVAIEQQPRDNGPSRLAIRAKLEDDTTALILEAGCLAAEDAWRTLLEATA